MGPDDYGVEDSDPISEQLALEGSCRKSSTRAPDDLPLPEPRGTKAQSHIAPPPSARDLTNPSQAPNPHKSNGHINGDSPVAGYFNLYKWHPFTELFCVIAEWFEPDDHDVEQRRLFAEKHPRYFAFAMFADFTLLLLIVLGILGAILFIALRTIGIDIGIEVIRVPVYWPEFGRPGN